MKYTCSQNLYAIQKAQKDPSLIQTEMSPLNLSTRATLRILKLAYTIADFAGREEIQSAYFADALQ